MARGRHSKDFFICNHCGADVPSGSKVCRECGSDADTGWSQDSDKWEADIPSGYSHDGGFDYDEFIANEFPDKADSSKRNSKLTWRVVIAILAVIGALCMALSFY